MKRAFPSRDFSGRTDWARRWATRRGCHKARINTDLGATRPNKFASGCHEATRRVPVCHKARKFGPCGPQDQNIFHARGTYGQIPDSGRGRTGTGCRRARPGGRSRGVLAAAGAPSRRREQRLAPGRSPSQPPPTARSNAEPTRRQLRCTPTDKSNVRALRGQPLRACHQI